MTSSQFSAFAPSGIRFTRRKSKAKAIYETLRDQWGTLFTDDPTAAINVEAFAQAKCLAIAAEQLERAGNQANPRYVTELLPKLETDYLLSPLPGDSIATRKAELIAARTVRAGERMGALRDGLWALLGGKLLAVVPQAVGTIGSGGTFPDSRIGYIGGPGNFVSMGAQFRAMRLQGPIAVGSRTVQFTHVAGSTEQLIVGTKVAVDPSKRGLAELVTVTASTETTFTATFTKAHGDGCPATTAAVPYWISGRRFIFIVVTAEVLLSQPWQQKIHRHMRKAAGHGTQWGIVGSSGAGTAGPFVIGESLLGQTPIVEVTY